MSVAARQIDSPIHILADNRPSEQIAYYFLIFLRAFNELAGRAAAAGAVLQGILLLGSKGFAPYGAHGQGCWRADNL